MLRRIGVASGVATAGAYVAYRKHRLPSNGLVLELDLSAVDIVEKPESPLKQLTATGEKKSLTLRDAVRTLQEAAEDERVTGLVARLGGAQLSLATTQELAQAVDAFRERKGTAAPTYAFAPEYQSSSQYLLACHFGTVLQQPGASLRLPSVSIELPFLAGLLARWGFRFEKIAHGEYKSGFSTWSDRGPSKAQMTNAESLLESNYEMLVRGVSKGRGLRERHVRRLGAAGWFTPERGALTASEAMRHKLIDGEAYEDALADRIKEECKERETRALGAYHASRRFLKRIDAAAATLVGGAASIDQRLGTKLAPYVAERTGARLPPSAATTPDADATASASEGGAGGKEDDAGATPPADSTSDTAAAAAAAAIDLSDPWSVVAAASARAERGRLWLLSKTTSASALLQGAGGGGGGFGGGGAPSLGVVCLQGAILPESADASGAKLGLKSAIHVRHARKALKGARDDPSVKAVVVRIDSPGGEALASAAIAREVELTRRAGKPVVVSIGTVGASGGYMIAASADKIIAQPGTLTGSIGVLSGALDISGFLKQQRMRVEVVSRGAPPLSASRPLSKAQRHERQRLVDAISADFEGHVAKGRHMSRRQVRRAAEGRVWTGAEAKLLGLVDELGGFELACKRASEAAGLGREWESGALATKELDSAAAGGLKALASQVAHAALGSGSAMDALVSLGAQCGMCIAPQAAEPPRTCGVAAAAAHTPIMAQMPPELCLRM